MRYAVLYDIADHNPIPYLLPLITFYLIIVVLAIRVADHGRLFRLLSASNGGGWMIVLGVGLLATIIASEQILIYSNYLYALSQGQYQIVEGSVEEFTPRPIYGHGVARFTVNGIGFIYVANDLTAALQQPQPLLPPLQNGRYVRVSYTRDYSTVSVTSSTIYKLQILKLEILHKPEPSPTNQSNHFPFSPTPQRYRISQDDRVVVQDGQHLQFQYLLDTIVISITGTNSPPYVQQIDFVPNNAIVGMSRNG